MKNLSDASLAGAAESFGSEVTDFEDVTFGSFYIDGAGVEPALVGAITETTEKGKVSAPVKGISGVYLFEVTAIDPAERRQQTGRGREGPCRSDGRGNDAAAPPAGFAGDGRDEGFERPLFLTKTPDS